MTTRRTVLTGAAALAGAAMLPAARSLGAPVVADTNGYITAGPGRVIAGRIGMNGQILEEGRDYSVQEFREHMPEILRGIRARLEEVMPDDMRSQLDDDFCTEAWGEALAKEINWDSEGIAHGGLYTCNVAIDSRRPQFDPPIEDFTSYRTDRWPPDPTFYERERFG